MAEDIKIYILNIMFRKWLSENEDKIIDHIQESFLQEQNIEICREDIKQSLLDSEIAKKT